MEKEKGTGRPTKYDPSFDLLAYERCLLGYSDKDLAKSFGISMSTLYKWKLDFPEFSDALKRGKEVADIEIVNAMFKLAKGAEWVEEQAIKVKISQYEERIEIVEVKRASPPNVQAGIFWLTNRQPSYWKNKQHTQSELTGKNGEPIKTETKIKTVVGEWVIKDCTGGVPLPPLDE